MTILGPLERALEHIERDPASDASAKLSLLIHALYWPDAVYPLTQIWTMEENEILLALGLFNMRHYGDEAAWQASVEHLGGRQGYLALLARMQLLSSAGNG
ncbi:hypothetical protein [Thermithiobacillus plumbiphilus]|uniref:Uncharacterized protein n=1 Tax=Thermithiobacillus plumbiphilus TaxID=1729899 RepID=A0ABU9D4Z8_9PROT